MRTAIEVLPEAGHEDKNPIVRIDHMPEWALSHMQLSMKLATGLADASVWMSAAQARRLGAALIAQAAAFDAQTSPIETREAA